MKARIGCFEASPKNLPIFDFRRIAQKIKSDSCVLSVMIQNN